MKLVTYDFFIKLMVILKNGVDGEEKDSISKGNWVGHILTKECHEISPKISRMKKKNADDSRLERYGSRIKVKLKFNQSSIKFIYYKK